MRERERKREREREREREKSSAILSPTAQPLPRFDKVSAGNQISHDLGFNASHHYAKNCFAVPEVVYTKRYLFSAKFFYENEDLSLLVTRI